MRIGLLADIHENVAALRLALGELRARGADKIVTLGDLAETGANLAATVELLAAEGVEGVYGNHDLGLCHEPDEVLVAKQPPEVADYMASLNSRFELEQCLFTHGAPWWDAIDPAVYYLGDRPHEPDMLERTFGAFPHAIFFMGHFHRWQASNEQGDLMWDGKEPLHFASNHRYLVTIHAVFEGFCAVFDSDARTLHPVRLG